MRKIYLVKKNPELPADGNNWLVMNSFEFRNFIQTPEGQKRRDRFGQLDACSVDDVIIIAECGTETAKQWRSEKDRHDYLVPIENQSGMTVFSYNTQTTTVNEMFDLWCQLKRGIKDSTFKNYIYMYELFVKPSFGKNRLVQVKKSDVRKFYNSLADGEVLKIATIDMSIMYSTKSFRWQSMTE